MQLGAGGALVHAKRGKALLKLKRPYAAKLDGDKAIEINPDSAAAYRIRGMANRCALIGRKQGF
jgi:suppressor of tumorigenicity protein 13